jgi:hypothetical protein
MKLYDVPRNSKIRVLNNSEGPPGSSPFKTEDIIKFHKIDGMYSFCTKENGVIVHLKCWEDVEIIK